jgi:CBS domain-containing protein
MVAWLATINFLVLIFNLLPAFPMDGGRVVRAIAWWRTGDRTSATRFAAGLGRVFAYLFIAAGLLMVFSGLVFGGIWLALIGMLINGSARAASAQTRVTGRIEGLCVADVMDREPVAIPSELSVEQALDEYFLRYRWSWFPVIDAANRFVGLVVRDKADEVPETSRTTSMVSDLVERDDGTFQVRDDAPLDYLLAHRAMRRFGAVMAVDADGRLSGVITAEQVGRALRDACPAYLGVLGRSRAEARHAPCVLDLLGQAPGECLLMIEVKSVPGGRVPKAWPQSLLSLDAQKASATAGSP